MRVLSAFLREDVAGLRTRTTPLDLPDGRWLRLPPPEGGPGDPVDGSGAACGGTHGGARDRRATSPTLLLPVAADGFQAVYAARLPLLRRECDGCDLTTTDAVLAALRDHTDPVDRAGFEDFAEECRQTLATMRLHEETRGEVLDGLVARYGPTPADWTGPDGGLAFDTLAARHDHPVYPTARGRAGLLRAQLCCQAPEFHPRFALRWLAVPRDAVTSSDGPATVLPAAWPTPTALGLDGLDDTHVALPVHPSTVGAPLREALRATGLTDRAHLADRPYLDVVPTLSMRTVAVAADPTLHLKLPLATATLGRLNRRTIKPGTLADGATGQRLLAAVIDREPRFRDTVLLADETTYAQVGHELLAVLCRRLPAGLDASLVVPLAALPAEAPDGRLVLDHLAERFHAGDPVALLDDLLRLLLDLQTTLFAYGVALESHQQNVSLLLVSDAPPRLLLKDNDGPRVHRHRVRERLGPHAPLGFDDPRVLVDDDRALTDLFTTVTVHLCAGAFAFDLARRGCAPRSVLLGLVRARLEEALARLDAASAAVLRARVLDAPHLPVKAMVTAGTLLSKVRSGAVDINKYYTTGPNYLLPCA
ncbi:IucA/IucC family protein [Streptomyces sp. NPDC060194]|uniref:IucA/IucC family protein n=1 Tax=Streptomyces sp. NPDC060194 TaxID=3347069 RepID=UPI00364744E5